MNGTSPRETIRLLGPVLRAGFGWALDADSRFLAVTAAEHEDDEFDAELAARGAFQFSHDRVQQAAYALIPEADRRELHLGIGRLLLKTASPEQLESRVFERNCLPHCKRAQCRRPATTCQ